MRFCREIVEATSPFATVYKINFAFFEALGPAGWEVLRSVRDLIPAQIPVIADAKRGDIGSTAEAYASAIFEQFAFDAVTVNPYLGWDALQPFMAYAGRCLFVLCRTSNPGSGDLQELHVDGAPLYEIVARQAFAQPSQADIGLVMAGTFPESLRRIRALSGDRLFLVPGIGAQGAESEEAMRLAGNDSGENALISVSRDILQASSGPDYAQAAGKAAERYHREMARVRGNC